MNTALVWLRRDLRLADNPALAHACAHHAQVVPVFIWAPDEEAPWAPGAASRWWLHHSLAALADGLAARASCLVLRCGPSLQALLALAAETGAEAVYWNRLYEPALTTRDTAVKAALRAAGLRAESFQAHLLWEPWTLATGAGEPYRVFTPFWKTASRAPVAPPRPAPGALPAPVAWPASTPLAAFELLPRIGWDAGLQAAWTPGEVGALARLGAFTDAALARYRDERDRPGLAGVSRLSPHLHFGEVSPRQVWHAVTTACAGAPLERPGGEAFLRELGWREFAHHVLFHFPHTAEQPMQERFARYPWAADATAELAAWQRGRTGYPLVDAGMRELWTSGWMHNRVRMLVASFLVKNLRIPWQDGARWFWDTLVDADLAANSLGWQWTAGCGTDAAPYFRVFNPQRQGEQFDADGRYVRRWVPELAALPERWLHAPWTLPAAEQTRTRFVPGLSYPRPLVDFAASRAAALAGFEAIRAGAAP